MLQEQLWFRTLRNRFVKKTNKIEEEIELREQTRNKIDKIEKLEKEVKELEFKGVKILQDLNYKKYDEIVEIAKIERLQSGKRLERLGASKESTDKF